MPKVAETPSGGFQVAKRRGKSNQETILADNINEMIFTNSDMPLACSMVHRLADEHCIRHIPGAAVAKTQNQRYWLLGMPSRRASWLIGLIQN